MASSVVYQGLQSCLEPRFIEPLVLSHKLLPPPQSLLQEPKLEENSLNQEHKKFEQQKNGGWSFLKALETPSSQTNNHVKSEEVYVHPMVKRSASALSTKSLEMCTESLGSETGSDVGESGDEFPCLSWDAIRRSKSRVFDKKMLNHRRGDFPPPLTSISGTNGTVKVRPHREGGRLVIKAVSVSSCGTNFQAERTNGRLRLSLLMDCFVSCESGRVKMKQEVCNEEGGEVETDHEYEYDDDDDDDDHVEVAAAVDEEEEEGGGGGGWGWDMDGNKRKVELKRPTRCKEGGNGNKGLPNWSSVWVAIS